MLSVNIEWKMISRSLLHVFLIFLKNNGLTIFIYCSNYKYMNKVLRLSLVRD